MSVDGGKRSSKTAQSYKIYVRKVVETFYNGDFSELKNFEKWSEKDGILDILMESLSPATVIAYLQAHSSFMLFLDTKVRNHPLCAAIKYIFIFRDGCTPQMRDGKGHWLLRLLLHSSDGHMP